MSATEASIPFVSFAVMLPDIHELILVQDHEGNLCMGVWSENSSLIKMREFPFGIIVKWCSLSAELNWEKNNWSDGCFKYICPNGYEIHPDELYDSSTLFADELN